MNRRPEIAASADAGHHDAESEGVNRAIKLVAHDASGCRDAGNQRLRDRRVTTR
ncbi:hypothetical protein ABZ832_27100 [Streptantibioticus parmotrematis]|uniref:hypothetical protein n=1 Tax=Streptantibioticus parmotrematis TaxID=2873249 RepID=UPI0033E40480